jgi:hypothetical protein
MFPTPELISSACQGALLAIAIRWVFRLDVSFSVAICVGILSRLFGVWALEQLTSPDAVHVVSTALMTISATAALLGVMQLMRGH